MYPKMPLSSLVDGEYIYVNSKQYRRILLRREQRKRLGLQAIANKQREKPKYKHESRHRHAVNRERGKGGRFI
jgi:nuclear transcription factor Y alpha